MALGSARGIVKIVVVVVEYKDRGFKIVGSGANLT